MVRHLLLVATVLVAGCTPLDGRRSGTVVFASGADLQGMNSLITTHPLAGQVQRHVLLTTLVRHDSALSVVPYLARRWTWSADSLVLTFHLIQGLRWHDGAATTAHDVAFTIAAAMDPATGYPRLQDISAIDGVEAPDDSTVVIRANRAEADILDVLAELAILPSHLLRDVPRAGFREAAWNRQPVGNGPFRFVRREPGRRWVFEADSTFPAELGGPPRITRLVIAVVDEPTTKLAALTAGELDFAGISPAHARFVASDPALDVLTYPLLFSYVITLNARRPPFDDIRVRRAVASAINRRAIVDGYLFGFGTPADSPVPPELRSTIPDASPDRRSGDRSLEPLSAEASFELLTVGSGDAALEQMLIDQFARVGLRAKIRQLELTSFLDRVHGDAHDFDAAVMGVSGDKALGHLRKLVQLSGMTVATERDAMLRQLDDSVPVVMLYHARGVQGTNRRVAGVHMDIRGELASIVSWRTR